MADNSKPIEKHVYDFLVESFAALDEDHSLFGADIHRTTYQKFDDDKWFGVRISNAASDLAPNPGSTEMVEFDGQVILAPFARIRETDHSDLDVAVGKVFDLQKYLAGLFCDINSEDGVTMNDRVNDARILRSMRDLTKEWNSALYAIANLPMLINDSGSQ